jgi:hypothetical protein
LEHDILNWKVHRDDEDDPFEEDNAHGVHWIIELQIKLKVRLEEEILEIFAFKSDLTSVWDRLGQKGYTSKVCLLCKDEAEATNADIQEDVVLQLKKHPQATITCAGAAHVFKINTSESHIDQLTAIRAQFNKGDD